MKRALQYDSIGGGVPAAGSPPDCDERMSPPMKRVKLASCSMPGVSVTVVAAQTTLTLAASSASQPTCVPLVTVRRQCPSNVLPSSLVSGEMFSWLSSRMCSFVRMVSKGWKAFVGRRYDAGPHTSDEFRIFRFSPRLLIFAPGLNTGLATRKWDVHIYIRCPKRTVRRPWCSATPSFGAARPPRRRSHSPSLSLTTLSHARSLLLNAMQRLVGGRLRYNRHGTYQTPGDPANYHSRVYGSVVGNAFVQSSSKHRAIVDF